VNLLIDDRPYSIEKLFYDENKKLSDKNTALQQENTQLKSEIQVSKHVDGYFRNLEKENTQLKSELQDLRERLKSIEYDDCDRCSYCSRHKEKPHADYCWLKFELDKLEEK